MHDSYINITFLLETYFYVNVIYYSFKTKNFKYLFSITILLLLNDQFFFITDVKCYVKLLCIITFLLMYVPDPKFFEFTIMYCICNLRKFI